MLKCVGLSVCVCVGGIRVDWVVGMVERVVAVVRFVVEVGGSRLEEIVSLVDRY